MTEQQIQSKIIKRYEADGWFALKVIRCNKNGFPDIIFLKDGKAELVEVKRPKGRLSKIQEYRIKELKKYGFEVKILRE